MSFAEALATPWGPNAIMRAGSIGRPPTDRADVLVVGLSVDRHLDAVADEVRARRRSVSVVHIDVDFGGGVNLTYDPTSPSATFGSALVRAVTISDAVVHHAQEVAVRGHGSTGTGRAARFIERESNEACAGWLGSIDAGYWIDHPVTLARARSKPVQLSVAARVGLPVPRSVVTADPTAVRALASECGEVICKPLGHPLVWQEPDSTGFLHTTALSEEHLGKLGTTLRHPMLFQERLAAVCEYRVVFVAGRSMAVRITEIGDQPDWRRCLAAGRLRYAHAVLDSEVGRGLAALMAELGLSYACIDLLETVDGTMHFLEANPDGSFLWLERQAGVDVSGPLVDELLR